MIPSVKNSKQYVENYAALAAFLDSNRQQPHPGEILILKEAVEERRYHSGSLSTADMFLMTALLGILQPRQALEIGTASGASAALMAQTIAHGYTERGEPLPRTILHSIDRSATCLFDETKPIGFMVAEAVPQLAGHVELHTLGDSSWAAKYYGPKELPFGFIDGNHQHPWPLIDLLNLLPLMQPSGWIVLDDINLPDFHTGPNVRFGPRYLFEAWPAKKMAGYNVGVVQIPANLDDLRPMIAALLEKPFEVKESGWKRYQKQLDDLVKTVWRK